jgi:hypothetical protein
MSTSRRTTVARVYNEMHGLIVAVGKNYCRKSQAQCDECPLRSFLPHGEAGPPPKRAPDEFSVNPILLRDQLLSGRPRN